MTSSKDQKFSLLYTGLLLTSESPVLALEEAKKALSESAKEEKNAAIRAYPKSKPTIHRGKTWATITMGADRRSSLWTHISIVPV